MPNMYASAVCSGKVTPGGKKNRKKKVKNRKQAIAIALSEAGISKKNRRK